MIEQIILSGDKPLPSPSLSTWPLHLVRLSELGLDRAFIQSVRPSFDRTRWDHYDVLSGTLQYLQQLPGDVAAQASRLQEIPDADARAEGARTLVSTLDAEHQDRVATFRPHRRRAMRRYRLQRATAGQWSVEPLEDTTFKQAVTDFRAKPRTFALMEPEVACHPGLLSLLASAAETVHTYRPDARCIDAYAHQVTVVARPNQSGHPAPEGLHQDGADFIVSAMVIERDNVRGGLSRVFEGRGGTPALEIELQQGEGIFQMDAGSNLWHEVTPVQVDDASREGHRMTFGFDFHIA